MCPNPTALTPPPTTRPNSPGGVGREGGGCQGRVGWWGGGGDGGGVGGGGLGTHWERLQLICKGGQGGGVGGGGVGAVGEVWA